MDSIRVSEAPDPGSIPGEATTKMNYTNQVRTSSYPHQASSLFSHFGNSAGIAIAFSCIENHIG